jgi:hypothetical protein
MGNFFAYQWPLVMVRFHNRSALKEILMLLFHAFPIVRVVSVQDLLLF